jgi:hypothetical protein
MPIPDSSCTLFLISGPVDISTDRFISPECIEGIEFPAKIFLRELFMDKGMTAPANIDAPFPHVRFFEVFFEPLVSMTASRYQVMEADLLFTTAESAAFAHEHIIRDWVCIRT